MTHRYLALILLLWSAPAACAFDPFSAAGIDQRQGAAVPLDLAFRDETGAVVTLRALSGSKPMLLAPVLHNCPNICGVTLSGLAQAIKAQDLQPGADFAVIAFGIDPKETTKDAATALDALRRAHPQLRGIHALTGAEADIRAVTDALGYRYGWDDTIGQYAHIAAVAVLDANGRLARWLYGVSPDPADLKLALTEAGEGRLGSWSDRLLLLCYHYDPKTGRYGPAIWTAIQVAGSVTAAVMIGLIAFAVIRERRAAGRSGS
jgi:protein SCO1